MSDTPLGHFPSPISSDTNRGIFAIVRLDEVEKQQVAKRLVYWRKLNEEFIYLLLIAIRLLSDVLEGIKNKII